MSENDARIFVDSNLLVYAYDKTAGAKHDSARSLLNRLWNEKRGSLSVQVLQEFYVVATQKVPRPLDPQLASDIVMDFSYWQVHAPVAEDVLGATDLQQRYSLSFWDSMIVWSAQRLGCVELWSEDLSSGQEYDDLLVVNPLRN